MMQVGTNQSTTYHSQPSIPTSGGQPGRSSSTSRQQQQQQQQSQYDNDQLSNIRPRICTLRKWPHYDGYGVHLARNQHWLGLRVGDVEPNSPAESGGLLREDVVLAVNGHSVENDDFFVILSFIQHELENDQIRFLVLDPHSADLARRQHLNIDENYRTCVRMETPTLTVSPEKLLYDQWRATNIIDPTKAQNTVNLGPSTALNQNQLNANIRQSQQKAPHTGGDDVYTFLPYSDHALENGKSYFELLFEQDGDSLSTPHHALDYPSKNKSTGDNANLSSTQSTQKKFAGDDNVSPSAQQQQKGPQNTTKYPSNIPGNDSGFPSDQQQPQGPHDTTQYPSNKKFTGDNEDVDFDADEDHEHKGKKRGQSIKDGVKNLVKSGVENIKSGVESLKSALPTHHDDKDKHHDDTDAKRKASVESLEKTPATAESSSLIDKLKNKLKGSDSPSNTTDDLKNTQNTADDLRNTQPSPPPIPQGRFWQKSEDDAIINTSLRPEPRMCSLTLRPGETIGISVAPDKDFGHVIKNVDPNSPAARSGIERDDCMLSINDTSLLNLPYEDVLKALKESRRDPNLDFLVAKKSYLLQNAPNNPTLGNNQNDRYAETPVNFQPDRSDRYAETPVSFPSDRSGRYDDTPVTNRRGISDRYTDTPVNTNAEVMPSSNLNEKNIPSTVPASQTLEQLFNKYTTQQNALDGDSNTNRPRETVSTTTANERYDRLSPQLDDDRYPSKQQQGQILHGVGPATADRSSWGVSSGKSNDDFPPPFSGDSSIRSIPRGRPTDASDATGRGSSLEESFKPLQVGITNPAQQSSNVPSSVEQREISPKSSPSPDTTRDSDREDEPTTPNKSAIRLATMPLSELKDYGYELHNIQLMQPTETSPVGLKLTKQQDPVQYVITAVAKGTKADLAGLKVNDWLIKIEDNDIRLVEFSEVSQDIRQLLTNAGLINMVVARKKTPTSTPVTKPINKEPTPTPSKTGSIGRQQEAPAPSFVLTTDITQEPLNNNQVRFTPDEPTGPSAVHSETAPISNRETNLNAVGGPLSVGLTNRISGDNLSKSPRSQSRSTSRSPTREYTLNQQQKQPLTEEPLEEFDPKDIRHVELKEALGLDFNSFIPESDSEIQTHFISNVQPQSMADKAGLRDGDRILTVNGVDVTNAIHEDVRRMMQSKKPLQLTVVNDPKYVELIENVKQNQNKTEGTRDKTSSSPPPNYESVEQNKSGGSLRDTNNRNRAPIKSAGSETSSGSTNLRQKSESPKSNKNDLAKYLSVLFTDNEGPVQIKHCLLKKDPGYNGYGLLLRYQNGLHLIDQVEENSPAYNAGLREDDVILYVDRKNVEEMTHDDVKILIRKLSLSNTNIDLILMKKNDIPRYKNFEQNNAVDWKPVFRDKLNYEAVQTEQQEPSVARASNDQTSASNRSGSVPSVKQQAPNPPTSTTGQSTSTPGTRVCTLYPSAQRTAGFALSGKAPPPYVICQIEENSPAEKAGLRIDDVLLSINGISVTQTSYEDTVRLVKEALGQKSVELVVRDQSSSELKDNLQNQDQTKTSMGSRDSNVNRNDSFGGQDPTHRGTNAVEEYQKQRNKELSYTLRLCHLHPTNGDGSQAATFGFELSEEPDYEYPLILRVEPHSSAEGAGLQSRDILLKINDRKTKGLGYEKVKKEIDKAKRDGRLEMLVVDQETYDYCKRTKKPLKEPELKVKHVFPKSRSSASFHKLPIVALASRDSAEQLSHSITKNDDNDPSHPRTSVGYHLSTPRETDSENEEDKKQSLTEEKTSVIPSQAKPARHSSPAVNFDLSPPSNTRAQHSANSHETPLKFMNRSQIASQQSDSSTTGRQSLPNIKSSSTSNKETKGTKGSKSKAIPNAINNLFHRIGHPKSSKPDYDAAPKPTKARAPSPPTVRVGHNRLEAPRVSQSLDTVATNTTTAPASLIQDTVRSTISTGSFDYLRAPRRCVLKVDRNKGLGFVLSATGDYDHTITAVEKYSAADNAGLQLNDEILEVDGVDVRNVKYEQVVEMLVSAMRTNDTIEMRVVDCQSRDAYTSTINADNQTNSNGLLNSNNNNNTITASTIHSQRTTAVSGDDLSDINSSISPFDSLNQQKIHTSYPNLPGQLRRLDHVTNRALSGSVPALSTGITASPSAMHLTKSVSASSEKGSITKLSDISTQDAPVARLCRVRKFATSPFYGFFLCGDPKKLGRVFISDVTKHSPAAVCGLRDGDRILEINGSTTDALTYETILDQIKQHMARDDLELLVLDKKSVHWYRERNYPITSRTLPTIVHIEPIINDTTSETQNSEIPATHTKMVGFADRRVSKTGL